jgi:hypothetical protein
VDLFRVFSWDGASLGDQDGGPLFVARARQGAGRHDRPERYAAWYCSRESVSAVAESIQYFRGRLLTDEQFRRSGDVRKALVGLRLADDLLFVDLDDPQELMARRIRPSRVATSRRPVTQRLAADIFEEGAAGLLWWSTLDAEWTNVTLFHERVLPHVTIVAPPRKLSTEMLEVQEAADHLAIRI